MLTRTGRTIGLVGLLILAAAAARAAEAAPAPATRAKLSAPKAETDALDAAHLQRAQKLINDGITFLLSRRDADGGWSMGGGFKPALTAMVLKALVQHPDFDTAEPAVAKGSAPELFCLDLRANAPAVPLGYPASSAARTHPSLTQNPNTASASACAVVTDGLAGVVVR